MIAVIARIPVKEGQGAEFEKAMLKLAEQVRANEPGNQMYTLCKTEAGEYVMLELYENEEALAAHGQSEHFKSGGAELGPHMAGRPEIERLTVIG